MSLRKISRIISLLIISSTGAHSGDHVCPRVENYTVTSIETYTEPIVVHTFIWCLQIPPRCPKTRTEMRQKCRVKTQHKTRIVNECCEGYRMASSHDSVEAGSECVPFCENCFLGVCVSPNECQCEPGYRGDDCASVCSPGTWGPQCKEECKCAEDLLCHPVTGDCFCPPGFHGQTCNATCSPNQWGPNCANTCNCKELNVCHPETGECFQSHDSLEEISTVPHQESTEPTVEETDYEKESSKLFETTVQETGKHVSSTATDYPSAATSPETTLDSDYPRIRTQTEEDQASSTTRPVIVLVSVPERRRNLDTDRSKFAMKNPYLRHTENGPESHGRSSPKIDYVKTVHKEDVPPSSIPLDIALIVVASIVSLGLTSVAVVMVLHMRSKLVETVRLSVYDDEKTKSQERETTASSNSRISTIMSSGGLPQPPIRTSNVYCPHLDPGAALTNDAADTLNNYANEAATIGLRLSGIHRDFLQDGHYDMPPATLIRLQPEMDSNTEHVYDEIPLQPALSYTRKYS